MGPGEKGISLALVLDGLQGPHFECIKILLKTNNTINIKRIMRNPIKVDSLARLLIILNCSPIASLNIMSVAEIANGANIRNVISNLVPTSTSAGLI